MSKYEALDNAIVGQIADGNGKFHDISIACSSAAEPFATKDRPARRVIDSRLQALRKVKKIAYVRSRWEVLADD